MAAYTVTTYNRSEISKKVNETDARQFITLPFSVEELGISDNIVLRKDEFTMAKAKAQVVEKIKAHNAKLNEIREYKIEVGD